MKDAYSPKDFNGGGFTAMQICDKANAAYRHGFREGQLAGPGTRAQFAAMAMQGWLSNSGTGVQPGGEDAFHKELSRLCVAQAAALLSELAKEKE